MSRLTSTYPNPEDYNPPPIREVIARQKRGEKPQRVTVDQFPVFADDPLRESHLLLDAFLTEAGPSAYDVKPATLASGKAILDTPIDQWPRHLMAALARVLFFWTWSVEKTEKIGKITMWRVRSNSHAAALRALVDVMLKRDPPLAEGDLIDLIESRLIDGEVGSDVDQNFKLSAIVKACESYKARHSGLTPKLHEAAQKLHAWRKERFGSYAGDRKDRELTVRLDELVGKTPEGRKQVVETGEPWAEAVLQTMSDTKAAARWEPLLRHGAEASGSKPSGKFIKDAKKLIDSIGGEEFVTRASEWLALAPQPRSAKLREDQITKAWFVDYDVYSMKNEDVLKGLAWACAAANNGTLAGPLGALAEACYKKIPNVGPRSPKVGNACLIALTMLPGQEPRAELSRLKAKVKQPTARKMIDKALSKSAEAAGMTTDDLEELAVPNYGLTEVIADEKSLKQLQKTHKDLAKMLSAQRDRLERLPMSRRELPFAAWRERYLDHPVVGTLARRLIWSFGEKVVGAWLDGKLVDVKDKPLKIDDETIVRLWHPSGADAATVLAWRQWLEKHEVTQPFKQAHREVYLLTDAERATQTYSNRFAAHILRQHIFAALCTQRGWKYRLMGAWDGGGDTRPTIELPRWQLRAEFWVDPSETNDDQGGTGVLQHVSTDQVRFCGAGNDRAMSLADVPPIVFSEIMRDVDLFVGVASIGNDPNWRDAGDRIGDYWQTYTFGELGISAQTRREVLERLLPRLKISSRCSLTKKFLVVKGDLRTYKIHLGSANILMEPNDQYLCIVAERGGHAKQSNLFLPFEGDQTLSIILSKAFLLVDDRKITDPTITRQISGK